MVKFADTQKDKDQKRLQQMQANLWNIAGVNMTPHYLGAVRYMLTALLPAYLYTYNVIIIIERCVVHLCNTIFVFPG